MLQLSQTRLMRGLVGRPLANAFKGSSQANAMRIMATKQRTFSTAGFAGAEKLMDMGDIISKYRMLFSLLGLGGLTCGIQQFYGTEKKFFEYKFETKASPEDLEDFYGNEDFMQIYCVFPFMQKIMMRGSSFDNDGICHTWGLAGHMEIFMDFEEGEGEKCLPDRPEVVHFSSF